MKIIITEEQKKKLFIPRRLSGENSRFIQWNKEQPIVDGVQINQYTHDGKKDGIWLEFYDEDDELYGSLESKQSYKNGEKDGVWEYYLESGELYYNCLYKNDKFVKILPKEITESEQSKKGKLFIPRRLSGENSRFIQWNKEQPIVDGVQINQYTHDGKKTGIWEKYWDNGQLWTKGSFKDGKRDGIWEDYYDNGKLNYRGSFKDGKRDGIWEDYYGNGKLNYRGSYKNGNRDGIWESYWDNGQLMSKGSFKNGKEDGIWEYYYGNGKLYSKGSFKDGKRDGIWESYHENGQLMSKQLYKDDELIEELPLTESEQSKKGKLFIPRRLSGENSRFIQWNKEQPIVDGVQINQYTHDGRKQGYWEDEYDYGEVNGKGSYINDKKDGYWVYYWDNGGLYKKGTYKDGKKDGIWEEYFKDGEFWYEGEWNNDKYIRDIRI